MGIGSHIEGILVVTGVLTASMLAQFVAPSWVVRHTFGELPSDALSKMFARHWGLLLFCIGALLFYSAFHPELRGAAVVLASLEKVGFVACVFGTSMRERGMASLMAAGDAAMVVIFVLYLAGL
jgi:hypothetical protein